MENQQTSSITIADLNVIKNVIDLASQRGAFRGNELREVGEVYNKLSAFLDAVVAQAQAQGLENPDAEQSQGE